MFFYSPTIQQIEEVIYGWAKHRAEVSILRRFKDPLEIVLIFEQFEDYLLADSLKNILFKKEWNPNNIDFIEDGLEVTIRLCPSGK